MWLCGENTLDANFSFYIFDTKTLDNPKNLFYKDSTLIKEHDSWAVDAESIRMALIFDDSNFFSSFSGVVGKRSMKFISGSH